MIHGIGTDIVAVSRLGEFYARHGERSLDKLLTPAEREEFARLPEAGQTRFLAKRFAAKEAFGKALGIRAPVLLPAIGVGHDALGKPVLELAPAVAALLAERRLVAHLSLSDEQDYAVAFVILEQTQP